MSGSNRPVGIPSVPVPLARDASIAMDGTQDGPGRVVMVSSVEGGDAVRARSELSSPPWLGAASKPIAWRDSSLEAGA